MALFDKTSTRENKRTADLTEQEQKDLAYSYASKDWHNIEGTLLSLYGDKYDENMREKAQIALYNYKLGLIQKKAQRSFTLPSL